MKNTFLGIVFLVVSALYGYQLYNQAEVKKAAAAAAAAAAAKEAEAKTAAAPGAPAAPTPDPAVEQARLRVIAEDNRIKAEAGLRKLNISTIMLGAQPVAQIDGKTYGLQDKISIPDFNEVATVREIVDGGVVFATAYHPHGFKVEQSKESLKSLPTN